MNKKGLIIVVLGLGIIPMSYGMEGDDAWQPTRNYEYEWQIARNKAGRKGAKIGTCGCCVPTTTASVIAVPLTGCTPLGVAWALAANMITSAVGCVLGSECAANRFTKKHQAPDDQQLADVFKIQLYRCADHNNIVRVQDVIKRLREIENCANARYVHAYDPVFFTQVDRDRVQQRHQCQQCNGPVNPLFVTSICEPTSVDISMLPAVRCKALLDTVNQRYNQYRLYQAFDDGSADKLDETGKDIEMSVFASE